MKKSILSMIVSCLLLSPALGQTISVNFGQAGSEIPEGETVYGVAPVAGSNWNNFMGGNGSATSVKDSAGANITTNFTWTGSGDYQTGTPTNEVGYLYKGFIDDHRTNGAEGSLTSGPYYLYDVILYSGSSDPGKKLHAPQINGKYYTAGSTEAGTTTVEGRAFWSSTANTLATTTDFAEGVNYLQVSNLIGNLTFNGGGNNDSGAGARGSICAIQIVNAYDYDIYSRSTTGDVSWNTTDAVWTLNGTENQIWANSTAENPSGIELTTTGATTVTVAEGTVTNNIRLVSGTNALTFTGGSLSFLGAALIDFRAAGNDVSPNIASKITGTIPSGELTIYGIGNTSSSGENNGHNTKLSNTGNDFVGNVRIKSGIVYANNDSYFGNASNKIILDGGGLIYESSYNSTRDLLVGQTGGLIRTYSNNTITVGSIADEVAGLSGVLRHTDNGTLQLVNNFNGFSGTFKQEAGHLYFGDGTTVAPSVNGLFPSKINMSGGMTRLNYKGELNFASGGLAATGGNLEIYGDSTTKVKLNSQGTISLETLAIRTAEVNVGAGTTINISGQFRTGDYTSCPTVLNIDGGTINANGTNNEVSNQASVLWGHWNTGATSTVNLKSGAFNSPNANVLLGWDSAATFNISGGTATVHGINLNSTKSNASTVALTGGTLNIGAGGIVNSNGTNKTVNFGAGTVGATADWTASGPINLTDETTGTTFATNYRTIKLSGNINGTGKVNVTGGGALEIGSAATLGDRAVSVSANSTLSFSSTSANTVDPAKMSIAGWLNVNDGAKVATNGAVSVGGWATNGNNLFLSQDGASMTVSGADLANNAMVTVSGGGTLKLTTTVLQQALTSSSMKLRLDASTITGVESGTAITAWADTSGNGNNAQLLDDGARGNIVYQVDDSTGLASVVFDSNGQTSLGFNRISDIRTVFWVVNDGATNTQSFLLGDSSTYNFHRGDNGELFANYKSEVYNGAITLNGNVVQPSAKLNQGSWDLLSLVTTGNAEANQLAKDRNANNFSGGMATRSWDGAISEIIIFNEALSADQVQAVNAYLNQKWNLGLTGEYFKQEFASPNTSLVLTDDTIVNAAGFAKIELKDLLVAAGKTATIVQDSGTVWKMSNVEGTIETSDNSALRINGAVMEIAGAGTAGAAHFESPLLAENTTINFDVLNTKFDVLTSSSTTDLTGALINVKFDSSYVPELDDSFEIILSEQTNGITGVDAATFSFDASEINMITDTFWFASLSADGKVLSVELGVPEPSAIVLLVLGLAGLFWMKRGKRATID